MKKDKMSEQVDAAPVKLAIEVWAERKGYLPQFFDPPQPPQIPPEMMGLPAVAVPMGKLKPPRANLKYPMFAAAKAGAGWATGKEVTEQEFDAALQAAGEHVAR